jgi:predicted ArsR family transcriptional regulator
MRSAAKNQRAADYDYWILGEGCCAILQVAVEIAFVCTD